MDLIGRHSQRFLATDHVEAEITSDYPEQRARYQTAIASGLLDTCSVIDPDEVALFLRLERFHKWSKRRSGSPRRRSAKAGSPARDLCVLGWKERLHIATLTTSQYL
jgi:hypothetical protein